MRVAGVSVPDREGGSKMKIQYQGTVQLGHLLVIFSVLSSAFGVVITGTWVYADLVNSYAALTTRVDIIEGEKLSIIRSEMDARRPSIGQIRENQIRLDNLVAQQKSLADTNQNIFDRLNIISENVATIKGRLNSDFGTAGD